MAGSYSTPAMWSPFTPTCLPTWFESDGRFGCERISRGGLPIAPAERISTLHSISSLCPVFGWRVGLSPSLSITEAVTT